jgi:hypothetical protein
LFDFHIFGSVIQNTYSVENYYFSFKRFLSAAQNVVLFGLLPWAVASPILSPSYAPDSKDFFPTILMQRFIH